LFTSHKLDGRSADTDRTSSPDHGRSLARHLAGSKPTSHASGGESAQQMIKLARLVQ